MGTGGIGIVRLRGRGACLSFVSHRGGVQEASLLPLFRALLLMLEVAVVLLALTLVLLLVLFLLLALEKLLSAP